MNRPSRRAGLSAANLVVLGYLLAAAVALAIHLPGTGPTWLVLHLLLLGAATNAIVVWSAHFATTLLQRPPPRPALTTARLAALNAGIVGVLVGVPRDWTPLTLVAAALLVATLLAHLASLLRAVHAGRTRRFAPTVRFYWVATVAVLLGITAGSALAVGPSSVTWWMRTYLVHVHLNLLGWVSLTVLGTLYTLWPTALRTRIVGGSETSARRSLLATAIGLAAITGGLLAGVRPLAVAGLIAYLLGLIDFLVPFVRTGMQRAPRAPATWMLAAGTLWLAAGVLTDAVAMLRDGPLPELAARVSDLVPWFVAGFLVQVLLGALHYLLPVVLGGPPAVGKRTATVLNLWGVPRVLALNAGVLLVALGAGPQVRVGWLLVAASIVAFAALAAAATLRSRLPSRAPAR